MKPNKITTLILLCVGNMLFSYAQQAGDVVTGTVSDSMGPLMMANVVELDEANRIVSSTITDMNGNFSFKIKDPRNRLKFMFVGNEPKIVPIKGTTYNIVMDSNTNEIFDGNSTKVKRGIPRSTN